MPSNEEMRAAEVAVMNQDHCGYSVKGKRVLCDDESLGGELDPYGQKLKQEECSCRKAAKAALEAAEGVRNANTQ